MPEPVSAEIDAILSDLAKEGVQIPDGDRATALSIASEMNKFSSTIQMIGGPGVHVTELITISSGRHRARSQKITNMTWELDKGIFEFLKGASSAGLGGSGVPLAIHAIAGATALTAPVVVLPIIAVVSVAAGLRWAGRAPVPIRAAYVFLHAWKLSEYHPEGHVTAVADLLSEIPVMLREYPIKELNEAKVLEDLNHLYGLGCFEVIPAKSAAGLPPPESRVIRLREKVKIKKTRRELF